MRRKNPTNLKTHISLGGVIKVTQNEGMLDNKSAHRLIDALCKTHDIVNPTAEVFSNERVNKYVELFVNKNTPK